MRTLLLLLLFWLLCGLMTAETGHSAHAPPTVLSDSLIPPKRLLILHSYHQGLNWTDAIQAGILESLAAGGQRYEVYTEYLDSLRFPQPLQNGFANMRIHLQ
ncbi:MAG: hypothetical protein KDJ31_12045, partial [Candidatus Competibacteraceae bacterium]|nr:hypothetical protein [Candidatus Competibacteraceae bacterium]